jgi:hypothetical protein
MRMLALALFILTMLVDQLEAKVFNSFRARSIKCQYLVGNKLFDLVIIKKFLKFAKSHIDRVLDKLVSGQNLLCKIFYRNPPFLVPATKPR